MSNSSKLFPSITSFISHAISLKEIRFPDQEIIIYCKENECSYDKIINIFQSYYERFKWNYDNFNEIVVLLSIAIKKIEFKSGKQINKEETQTLLKKALNFIEDVITSKMILVCLETKNKQKSIYQHFIYAKGFLTFLIPQILSYEFHSELLCLIENCNSSPKSKNFIGMNFIVEFMVILTTLEFLVEESEKKFKTAVLSILETKKKVIMSLLWDTQKLTEKMIQFKEIAYPRTDIESSNINHLELSSDGKLYINDKQTYQPQEWITNSYQKLPNGSVWRAIKLTTIVDIYQFLFKLEVFASSPLIEELNILIPESDEFIDLFSKFLMGQNLIQAEEQKQEFDSANVIRNIFEIKKMIDRVNNKAQKKILKTELSKVFSDSNSEEDEENQIQPEIEIDQ